jgi:hypothetical protein
MSCATTKLPSDYTLYRLGYMSGVHDQCLENEAGCARDLVPEGALGQFLEMALDRELKPAIAHFLLGAAYTSMDTLRPLFSESNAAVEDVKAVWTGVEARRLRSISGGFVVGHGRTVPAVVARFKSEDIVGRRARVHQTLADAGIPILELFEDGDTYPDGEVLVILDTCADEETAMKAAAAYAENVNLTGTVQVTKDFLSAITPDGLCSGL